ncbi:MAG: phosphotransferase [Actinomycetota bacterium]|nr:phosphotransferase [Actinomycetota bacterium]
MQSDLMSRARESFDLGDEDVSITPGARGARGQVWRLTAGRRVYALKQVSAGAPPAQGQVESEVKFARRAAAAGVRLPASHLDRNGEYVVPLTNGGWLRLYDWVELRSADLAATAEALGVLLARLHRCAQPVDRELNGAPPEPWYEVPPDQDEWGPLVTAATEAGMSWATRLAAAADGLPALHSILSSPAPARMRLCHRDLHPENVLADEAGELVVVDWEDIGPAEPAQELARTLVACYHDGQPDLDSMRWAYRSYVEAGGPARLRSAADFTMLIATQLNFLSLQVRVALDPTAASRDRHWAQLEIDESLRILPTPDLLGTVLNALEDHPRTDQH